MTAVAVERPDDLLTTGEVSDILRIPESTLRTWRHEDRGPLSFKLGRRVVYKRTDVEDYRDQQHKLTARGGRS